MPFPWLHPSLVDRPQRREAVYKQEFSDRAALLARLGYSRDEARARLTGNAAWDYEVGGWSRPIDDAEIDAVLDAAYRRGNAGGDLSKAL